MKLFTASLSSLSDLYTAELAKALDAEKTLVKALPRMARRAGDLQLRHALQVNLLGTQRHVIHVKRLLRDQGSRSSKVIRALLSEADDVLDDVDDSQTFDMALVSATQRIENYKVGIYCTLKAWARQLGRFDDLQVLSILEADERETARLLNTISERYHPGERAIAA